MLSDDQIKHYEDVAREMIRHEDAVIHNRMNWMTTINGLLFTALGFIWDKEHSQMVVVTIGVLGFIVCATSWTSLIGATQAMARIRRWWHEHKPKDYEGPGIIGLTAPFSPKFNSWADYFAPWDFTAFVLGVAWLVVLAIVGYHHFHH